MAGAFRELLQTLTGTIGLFDAFARGETDNSAAGLFGRIRQAFGPSLTDFEARQVATSLSRAVRAGNLFDAAGPGERVAASEIPITRQLQFPDGSRNRFVAEVAVSLDITIGRTTTSITRTVIVTGDQTLSPAQVESIAIDEAMTLLVDSGIEGGQQQTATVDVRWVFLTR